MSVKAFECTSVIDSFHGPGDSEISKIESIECCGKDLYLGTTDSCIISYVLEEKYQENGNIVYNCRKVKHRNLEQRKPIHCIKSLSAINRLLVQCDTSLLLFNVPELDIIGNGPRIRSVTTFCMNQNPTSCPFPLVQMCVARKRQLQVFNLADDRLALVKEINVSEPVQKMAMIGPYICTALQSQYLLYNFETNDMQQLFTYGGDNFLPLICSISQDEFLVSAREDLGMFVTTKGMSERPPVRWPCPPISLTYYHPYILGLNEEVIVVYSILDQQQKQVIPFSGGRTIGNFDGRLYVSSVTSVNALIAISWEEQVEGLLQDSRVNEALQLAQNSNMSGMTKEMFQMKLRKIEQKCGFIYFANSEFDKAREMFDSGGIDVREVISLFPGFLPSSSNFIRSVPPLHGIADVNQLFHGNEQKLKTAKSFLLHFLRDLRDSSSTKHALEVDTALLKLYSELNAAELEAFIVAGEITCDVKDCSSWLERHKCYHALALLYRHSQDHEKALSVWLKIICGEYQDSSFPGLQFFVECLANLKDTDLIWRYADYVLSQDEEIGVGAFTLRSQDTHQDGALKPDVVVEYLYRYPKAVIKYLEYIVLDKNLQVEKFHTQLAILYLENIAKLQKDGTSLENIKTIRLKLQTLLQTSNLCRTQLLLGKMLNSNLHEECAVLYGKIEEHEKALDILVNQLKDFKAAELYCENNAQGKEQKYRNDIFYTLLSIYLNPKIESPKREEFAVNAIELLCTRAVDFDATQVLQTIPSAWSIAGVEMFLTSSIRGSMHKYRMRKVESSLARGENLCKAFARYDVERTSCVLQETSYCCVCKKPFTDSTFARHPDSVLTHISCDRKDNDSSITSKHHNIFESR
ncbi:transforming growth factor-beta receptor-associated protein 1-like isoform X1 [Schistocerca americana]|uniref:transforming growth factor-beta receptor-associated protein 1-like isoform X1 n=1 Tax=Schistocerca americana TaxID=7009 RepID=UPI001F4F4DC5|nr:transforming growth factor-beta receptor-associated protein 1-like isoform X1 [Schistocerca americana]